MTGTSTSSIVVPGSALTVTVPVFGSIVAVYPFGAVKSDGIVYVAPSGAVLPVKVGVAVADPPGFTSVSAYFGVYLSSSVCLAVISIGTLIVSVVPSG